MAWTVELMMPLMRSAIVLAARIIPDATQPTIVLAMILPIRRSCGRIVAKMISTTRDAFSSVTRPPILPAKRKMR
ncbi:MULTISPECIES: hypothetical protein [unclassified Corynebacterium]|uniref:hypothetical protein n=1 Tax=Corynebacterium sp. sy017 TaxID=2499527 RepID=UPI001FEDAB6A|nr:MULTISPECIES: hypothetical protein [unclassified Corynebacterium]